MNQLQLYRILEDAYNEKNLNDISSRIITIYRSKQFELLLQIGKKLKSFINADSMQISRLFNRLILLYHPDKLNYYLSELKKYRHQPDSPGLQQFTHILHIQEVLAAQPSKPDNDHFDFHDIYCSQVRYGYDEDEFDSVINPGEENYYPDPESESEPLFTNFISIIQAEEQLDFSLNSMQFCLSQLGGELDLSNRSIGNLTGIEYCTNITCLDLSHNQLIAIDEIGSLHLLESLYLSGNTVSDISCLAQLKHLKEIDLSYNDIDNIDSLFDLPQLQYLNIAGNPVSDDQITRLEEKGILVIH